MTEWKVESDGNEFHPLPESWLDHPAAVDPDKDGPRCLAVSCLVRGGRILRVRYAHPLSGNVIETVGGASQNPTGDGYVPASLVDGSGWPRSFVPAPGSPVDEVRTCERRHMRDIWGERLDDVAFDYEREQLDADPEDRLVADGGRRRRDPSDDPAHLSATWVDDPIPREEYGDVQSGAPDDYRDAGDDVDVDQDPSKQAVRYPAVGGETDAE